MTELVKYHLYDLIVYDGARDIAADIGQNTSRMKIVLEYLGASSEQISEVQTEQTSSNYFPDHYRGKMCDDAVVELVKKILRPIHEQKYKEIVKESEYELHKVWGINISTLE